MTSNVNGGWDGAQRALLEGLLNEIVPPSADGRVPGAGAVDVADFVIARADADPKQARLFKHGVTAATSLVDAAGGSLTALDAAQRLALARQLEAREPEFFAALLRHTYMGYYSRGDIRPLFGLSAKPTQPDGYDVRRESPGELAAMLEPVTRRGRCYRDC